MFLAVVFCLLAACSSSEGKPKEHVEERTEEGVGESPEVNVNEGMEEKVDGGTGEDVDKRLEENISESPDESVDEGTAESVVGNVEGSPLIYGDYFKAGNAMYRLSIYEATPQEGGFLYISILRRDSEYSRYNTGLEEFHVAYREGTAVYEVKDEITGQDFRITFAEDGAVSVEGAGESEKAEELGIFYAFGTNLMMADAFERPLCRTDLIGLSKQDLRLLRNQFYAVYGRKFQDEGLR